MKHATYCGTRNLYEAMVWAAKSLVANSSVDLIHLLIEDDEFPYELPDGMFEVINVKEYAEATFPDGTINAKTHFTKMAMVRCCYEKILDDVDLLLQFDPDTVVLDNVDEIWDLPMDGKWFAATTEWLSGYDPYNSGAYNVGVCLFNLKQMREDNAQVQMVELLNTRKLWCIEQDALDILGTQRGKSVDMPVRFNENRATGYTDNPAVQHFVGYMDWTTNPNLPRREYLKLYRDKSWDEILEMRHAKGFSCDTDVRRGDQGKNVRKRR